MSSSGVRSIALGEKSTPYRSTEELENLVPVVQQRRAAWETQYEK